MHLISQSGNTQDDNKKVAMANMMKGLKKTIAKGMTERRLRVIEGKGHKSFKCYQKACQLLIEEGSPDSVFALCFLTMQWNLISRSEATEIMSFSQIIWENDHLKINFSKHKSVQIVLNKEETRHIYSNPKHPAVCPLRTLASYLLVCPQMFIDAKNCFLVVMKRKDLTVVYIDSAMHYNAHIYETLFVDPKEIRFHSIRKGAATYCCAGVHPGSPIVSVRLGAGWTLGRVKERYLNMKMLVMNLLVGHLLVYHPPTANLEFPIQHSKLISLSHILSATYIFHENWTVQATPQSCRLRIYFSFPDKYPNRLSFVKISLPWENNPD